MKGFMSANEPFGESNSSANFQIGLGLDDGGGLLTRPLRSKIPSPKTTTAPESHGSPRRKS